MTDSVQAGGQPVQPIAVVGMAGRFPGAADVERFWSNLRHGVSGIRFFSDEELLAAGVAPERLRDPEYVRACGVLEGADRFDAAFFGFNPREAAVLDPQQRVFLETAWEALENAGYAPGSPTETVGIYAGCSDSDYLQHHVKAHPEVMKAVGGLQAFLANSRDFLATRAAHKLDLRGPALTVQTACSTGLVAVHVACQALAAGECDVALAGGVTVNVFQDQGYPYVPGGIGSPDGHCRAFDNRAAGTVGGNGIGLVVLKRLADALADGDTIRAVIRGSAINNDGAQKVGFTAPSVEGQAAAIEEALAVAGVDPRTVGFVEAHGTGTELGDPVEVAALTQAFGPTPHRQYCALGAVKASVGHLDAAAGTTGLIKAVLAVQHGEIPPTLNFTAPNPRIDFASSPFFVNAALRPWTGDGAPRRAGVSSFGMGGTNAHVVLEQAPDPAPSAPARDWQLVPLSARTPEALEAATDRLAAHLRAHPEQALADVAWTLQAGRRTFEHRRVVVARDHDGAAAALESRAPDRVVEGAGPAGGRPVDFLFSGMGSQYPGMGRGLYEAEPVYRREVDRCAGILRRPLGLDLREVLFPPGAAKGDGVGGAARIHETRLAQLAIFVTGYALARLWMHWGIRPRAMIGHSLGEYVAATVSGVWSLEDGLLLVAERARLIDALPEGAMLAVALGEGEARARLRDGLCIAAVNGPAATVVSGPAGAVESLREVLEAEGVFCRRLPVRHAFHSRLVEPAAAPLADRARGIRLRPPSIPFVSNVTGEWIRDAEATDPDYWARHLCAPVRFAGGIATLVRDGGLVLLEVGAGHALRSLVARLPDPPPVVASLRHDDEPRPDLAHLLEAAGRLWAAGADLDWGALHEGGRRRRVPLPTYPFQRRRCWLDRRPAGADVPAAAPSAAEPADPAEWLHVPAWTRAPLPAAPAPGARGEWLLLADDGGVGAALARGLEARGDAVAVARAGAAFGRGDDGGYTVRPGSADDLRALHDALRAADLHPRRVVLLWGLDDDGGDAFGPAQARGYATVTALAGAFAAGDDGPPLRLAVVTEGVRDVAGGEPIRPERATELGACLVLPREHPRLRCSTVDVQRTPAGVDALVRRLLAELTADVADDVALRGPSRWVRGWQPLRVPRAAHAPAPGGAYLFCGALDGGAAALALHLAREAGARVALVADPALPPREAWEAGPPSGPEGDRARRLIALARELEAAGGEVVLVRASAADADGLRAALAEARRAFGRLDAVIHGVGDGEGDGSPSAEAGAGDAAALAGTARALAALWEATAGTPPVPVVLWSGLGSVAPRAGGARSAAAGALAEAWARCHAAEGGEGWTSVAWDRWAPADAAGGDGGPHALGPGEGAWAFALAAAAGEPRVVVCTEPPAARAARRGDGDGPSGGGASRAGGGEPWAHHPPTTPAEEVLAEIWRELLGVEGVGIHDDFFVLGGHSLLGLQLTVRVREAFQVELPLKTLFQAPTIAALAVRIDEAILRELEEMTDEEALEWMGEPR